MKKMLIISMVIVSLAFGCDGKSTSSPGDNGDSGDTETIDSSVNIDTNVNKGEDTNSETDTGTDIDSDTYAHTDSETDSDTYADSDSDTYTDTSDTEDIKIPLSIFAGGVSGIEDLAEENNSTVFRENGGGLYLHHSGWAPLAANIKSGILDVFADRPVTVELGFKDDSLTSWQNAYITLYHNLGIRPRVITLNAFSSDRVPDVSWFEKSVKAYRDLGVDDSTYIFATFEYQNFPGNIPALANNKVSDRDDFQQIIKYSGGLVIDTPSIVFFRREQNYRDWVIDAVTWTHNQGLKVGIIFSPNNAGKQYDEETSDYLTYLNEHDALPDFYFVENYSTADPATYLNVVGSEDVLHNQLGCAKMIQETVPEF